MIAKRRHLSAGVLVSRIGMVLFMGVFLSITPVEAAIRPQSIAGIVEVLLEGEQAWKPLLDTMQLNTGAQVRTGEAGEVELRCEDGSVVHLDAKTQIAISALQFSKAQKTRVFRFKLLQGTVTLNVVELDFTRFKLSKQSLENLRNEGIPAKILEGLTPLENREFTEEETFLNVVKEKIGGESTVRYKKPILEHADTKKNVFEIETDTIVASVASSEGSITNLEADTVTITQGRFAINQIAKGIVYILALIDAQEGLKFPLSLEGAWVRIDVDIDDRKIILESNVPLSEILALIGNIYTIMEAGNRPDTPPLKVIYKDTPTELKGDKAATFEIPAGEVILIVISEIANAEFQFFIRRVVIPEYSPLETPKQGIGSPVR